MRYNEVGKKWDIGTFLSEQFSFISFQSLVLSVHNTSRPLEVRTETAKFTF